jgi:hypothetical protein
LLFFCSYSTFTFFLLLLLLLCPKLSIYNKASQLIIIISSII